jgi:nucleotidyltransferase substrate binding protein (TIGR01987 family)
LSWKTLKDYLESKGFEEKFSRDVIKRAFENEIIENREIWIDMLDNRNLLSHTYDELIFKNATQKVAHEYYQAIIQLVDFFKKIQS